MHINLLELLSVLDQDVAALELLFILTYMVAETITLNT